MLYSRISAFLSRFSRIAALLGALALVFFADIRPAAAQVLRTPAEHAIMIEADTGAVLFEKAAGETLQPASMTKLMTTYLAFEAVKDGVISLQDQVTVSDEAWRNWNNRGSTMFLRAGDTVTVEDLLKGIIVLSGNDACVVLAEYLAGSHSAFVEWMNAKADQLAMDDSHFENANGWPAEGHVMTARDLATLSLRLINDFPDLYPMFAQREYVYKNFTSNRYNRNPLLGNLAGADGLKTGHTEASGYGLAGSAQRDGRRLILVVSGLDSTAARMRESRRLLQYGFRNFKHYPLLRGGETVDYAEVWLGDNPTVPLMLEEDLALTMSHAQRAQMEVSVAYDNPLPAPVRQGDRVGTLTVTMPGRDPIERPLLAGESIEEISGFARIGAAIEYYLFGSAGQAPGEGTP
ncbi:D-alanyl-D-alanine carboxypeptidase family protein [Yunchengibacter salinarum]|uniref:D-alanyl-D-alanine carboxypeptidase family protein n=1 Tax=Yunchengibacter salinarum TaxID=3133399 RepID=UPI0035B602A2